MDQEPQQQHESSNFKGSTRRQLVPSIVRDVRIAVAALILLFLSSGWLSMHTHLSVIPQVMYRDSAAFAAYLLQREIATGLSEDAAFDVVAHEVGDALPESTMALIASDGGVNKTSGGCSKKRARLSKQVFELYRTAYQGPLQILIPLENEPVCAEGEELLSGAMVEAGDSLTANAASTASILTVAATNARFSGYMSSRKGIVQYLLWSTPPILVLILSALVSFRIFLWILFSHARKLIGRARSFADGNLSERFEPGEFPEFEELAVTFNSLADEVAERIGRINRDEFERRELMAGLAHDLRTPMTAIEGCVSFLEQEALDPARARNYLRLIESGTEVQSELTVKLDELATLENRDGTSEFEEIDPKGVVEETVQLAQSIADQKNVRLFGAVQNSVSRIEGEPALLRRALLNLVDNALRHTPTGKSVRVELSDAPEGGVVFRVADEGSGMIHEGVESAVGKPARRPGLGLAIVQRVTKLHHGRIEIESRTGESTDVAGGTAAKGTTISLFIPERFDPLTNVEPVKKNDSVATRKFSAKFLRIADGLVILIAIVTMVIVALFSMGQLPKALGIGASILILAPRVLRKTSLIFPAELLAFGLLLVAAAIELQQGTAFALGMLITVVLSHLFTFPFLHSALTGLPLIFVFAFVTYGMLAPWNFLMGFASMLWLAGIPWIVEFAPFARRAGIWLGGILLCGAGFAAFLFGGSVYGFAIRSLQEIAREQSAPVLRNGISDLYGKWREGDDAIESIVHRSLLNPLFDYEIIQRDGTTLQQAGSFTDDYRLGSTLKAAQLSGTFPSHGQVDLPVSFRKAVMAAEICPQPECPLLALSLPGSTAEVVSFRELAPTIFYLVVSQLVLAYILLALYALKWSRKIRHRVDALKKGIRRYQLGDYKTPIGLSPGDDFGVLSAELDSLAERIPELELKIERQRARQRRFLGQAAAAVREGANTVGALATRDLDGFTTADAEHLSAASAGLRKTIEEIFEFTYIDRGEMRLHCEDFSVSELLLEEIDHWKPLLPKNVGIELVTNGGLCIANCAAEPFLAALRLILAAGFERTPPGKTLYVELWSDGEQHAVEVRDLGAPLSTVFLGALLAPFDDENCWPDEEVPNQLRGFSIALLASKLKLCGASLNLSPTESGGLRYVLSAKRHIKSRQETTGGRDARSQSELR